MERLIFEHGGSTIHAFSRTRITRTSSYIVAYFFDIVTDIVSSSGLSGKKLQDQIKCRKSATRIVRPEWSDLSIRNNGKSLTLFLGYWILFMLVLEDQSQTTRYLN